MKRQFQRSWHDIEFDDFIKVSKDKIAGIDFYNRFYKVFFQRYHSYSDIPIEYISSRECVVDYLLDRCESKRVVLSIGCGIGLIERLLVDKVEESCKIIAVEPSLQAIKWIKDDPRINTLTGYFPEVFVNSSIEFDYAYARAIDYIFDQKEYINFLENVVNFGIKEFSVVSVCVHRVSLDKSLKEFVKCVLAALKLYDRGQFWGYMRNENDHRKAFFQAGFNNIEFRYLSPSTLVVTGTI